MLNYEKIDEIEYFVSKIEKNRKESYGKFEGIKITFEFSSPVCLTYPWIVFDGIIEHFLYLNSLGRDFFITDKKMNLSRYIVKNKKPYGAMYHKDVRIAVPLASAGMFDSGEYKMETIYKRFEDRFCSFRGKIRIASGMFKSYAMRHIYIPARSVTFFVYGDFEFLKDLICRNIFAIGNDVRIGYGFVKKCLVERDSLKRTVVWNGIAMRPIPVEFCEEYEQSAMMAYRSPYWAKENVRLCVVPFTRCRLKKEFKGYEG